jgi:hypothetical protein
MTNSHYYILGTQIAISCSSLAFAMVMLYRGKDPGTYLPIITGIVGCWLPAPQSTKATGTNNSSSSSDALASASAADIEQPLIIHRE